MDTDRLAWAKHDNERAIANNNAALKRAAESMIDKMMRLIANVDHDLTVNTLGEVQGRGLEVDRLCALRGQLFDFRNTLEGLEADHV